MNLNRVKGSLKFLVKFASSSSTYDACIYLNLLPRNYRQPDSSRISLQEQNGAEIRRGVVSFPSFFYPIAIIFRWGMPSTSYWGIQVLKWSISLCFNQEVLRLCSPQILFLMPATIKSLDMAHRGFVRAIVYSCMSTSDSHSVELHQGGWNSYKNSLPSALCSFHE